MTHTPSTVVYPRLIGGKSMSMIRLIVVIAVLYLICCGLALGQAVDANNPPKAAPTSPREAAAADPVTPRPYYGQQAPSPADAPSMGALMQNHGGSLLQATLLAAPDPDRARLSNVGLTAVPDLTPKILKKHDLLTIIIHEEGNNSSNGTEDLTKQADLDAKLSNFVKLNLGKMKLAGVSPNVAPELNATGTRDFHTSGTVQRQDIVSDRITAEVLDVKPNNTLVLQARKRIKTDGEFQEFIMTGICRAEDVTADNTVLSTQCFDLAIQKQNTGEIPKTNQKGLIPKLLDFVDPF